MRHAADIPVGIAGSRGKFTPYVLGADIPELSRKRALEAPGGQLDFPDDLSTLRKQGVSIPPRLGRMGQNIMGVVDFGATRREKREPPRFRRRISNGLLRTNGPICPMADYVCPPRGMARISLDLRVFFRHVEQGPWGMRRIGACHIQRTS